ncbi:MAG: hypothetical protein PVJ05_02700 [Candidatus Thorarchaeota archaeon]|jgi:hypothetical protein
MNKPVIIEANLVPNLLQFTLVGLEAGDFHKIAHPPYRDEYDLWISKEKKDLFVDVFGKLQGVSSSTWFALLYQIPAYLSQDSLDSLLQVIELLSKEDSRLVMDEYPEKAAMVERYIPKDDFQRYVGFEGKPIEPWPAILRAYSDVVEDVHNRLYEERWKTIKPSLETVQQKLVDDYYRSFDWISWWEKRTGIEFVYPLFQVELIDAMTTMGTSLLAERDGFYAHADPLRITTMISHEICTHMLFSADALRSDIVGSLIKEDLERYLRTVEVISWSTNKEVIHELGFDWTMEKSFDWIGPQKDKVASLVREKDVEDYWHLMEKGYSLM